MPEDKDGTAPLCPQCRMPMTLFITSGKVPLIAMCLTCNVSVDPRKPYLPSPNRDRGNSDAVA